MFCKKCGAPIADGDRFCLRCGTPVSEAPEACEKATEAASEPVPAAEAPSASPAAPKKPLNKRLLIGIISAVAAVILTVVIVLIATGGTRIDQSSWKSTVESYISAIRHKDTDAVMSLLPMDLFSAYNRVTEREVHDELDAFFDQYSAYIDFGSITYTVSDYYELDEDTLDSMNRDYAFYAMAQQVITEAMLVRLTITYPIKGSQPTRSTSSFYMLRIGGKWYLYNSNGGF